MKTREQKSQLISSYEEILENHKSIILTDFSGLKTKPLFEFKNRLFENQMKYLVVKNRLFKIVLDKLKLEIPQEILDKPLGIVFGGQDEILPTKLAFDFSKENENLKIEGGILDSKFIDEAAVKSFALIPSKEELYIRLIGAINAPRVRFINALKYNPIMLINILKQRLVTKL